MGPTDHQPRGWLRRTPRAPLWLYRHGLGWMLGERFLYLVTRGRATGLARETTLEVVHLDRSAGTVYVLSGRDGGGDWYRNLQAAPALEIRLGRRRLPRPAHRFLTPEECGSILLRYRGTRPLTRHGLAPLIDPSDPAQLSGVHAVAFHPAYS
ncbi:nitroreductase/quinone reductase family protein [Sphaerisporangium aureirubrum]|uniref:Nitroreductase/quinone reductase family protein n=1 Tax=Sphaerisporangium aureirubrum TaxID=1544736 RepID=A0ABW1NFH1_9ACTN